MASRTVKPALPGQSRSPICSKACARLSGHKGDHRPTLTATSTPKVATTKVVKARKAPRTVSQCRVTKGGVRCSKARGHKALKLRHRFDGLVECNDCRATFSYADTAAFVPSDIDGRDFDGEPACPYCGGLL